jgi:rubrerythrin
MDFNDLNAVIDFAIEKEIEAAEFYDNASRQEQFSGKKQMLREFCAEERKHEALLKDLKAGNIGEKLDNYDYKWIVDIKRSDYVDEIEYHPGMAYNELLMLAMKREEAALKLYNELLDHSETAEQKKVFKMLCQEEAKHKLALETMYDDFMAQMGD